MSVYFGYLMHVCTDYKQVLSLCVSTRLLNCYGIVVDINIKVNTFWCGTRELIT